MGRYLKQLMVIGILLLFTIPQPVVGQLTCPPQLGGCGSWSQASHTIDLDGDCEVSVDVESRMCNGALEYRIIDITITGDPDNCSFFDNLNKYQYNASSLNEWIDLYLLYKDYPTLGGTSRIVPECSTGVLTHVKFYSASCGIWVKCTWDIEVAPPECVMGTDPVPDPPQDGKINVWKWQPCGETCCKRTYEVCEETVFNEVAWNVKRIGKERMGVCTDQGNYSPNQCEDGCL